MPSVTYPAPWVGTTLALGHDDLPRPGYRQLRASTQLGVGDALFATAARAVMSWELHRRAGVHVETSEPRATEGAEVTVSVGWGPLRISAPCMVVGTVQEPGRVGFAYGTLAGHPETGEEAFVVEQREVRAQGVGVRDSVTSPQVWLHIVAFSRPAQWWSRAGGPVTHWVQGRVIERYLRALTDRP